MNDINDKDLEIERLKEEISALKLKTKVLTTTMDLLAYENLDKLKQVVVNLYDIVDSCVLMEATEHYLSIHERQECHLCKRPLNSKEIESLKMDIEMLLTSLHSIYADIDSKL